MAWFRFARAVDGAGSGTVAPLLPGLVTGAGTVPGAMVYAVKDAVGCLPAMISRATLDHDFPVSPDQSSRPPVPAIRRYAPLTGMVQPPLLPTCGMLTLTPVFAPTKDVTA